MRCPPYVSTTTRSSPIYYESMIACHMRRWPNARASNVKFCFWWMPSNSTSSSKTLLNEMGCTKLPPTHSFKEKGHPEGWLKIKLWRYWLKNEQQVHLIPSEIIHEVALPSSCAIPPHIGASGPNWLVIFFGMINRVFRDLNDQILTRHNRLAR